MKLLGTSDERLTCDCCGKTNLKRTVVLETSTGDVVYYGVNCAAKALGKKSSVYAVEVDTVAYAQRLIGAGKYTPEQIRLAVWNKFGFSVEVKGDTLVIWQVATLALK